MDELISVIIPAYNVAQYLDRCVQTVVNQTYKNMEIILVDDGSTDGTSELCDKWSLKDRRIKVVHKLNGGLSSARNAGMHIATGSYIGFVDSDDWIETDMYEYLYNLIVKYNTKVAFCDFRRLKNISKSKKCTESLIVRENDKLDAYFYRLNGEKSSYAVWCGLYQRNAIEGIQFIEGEINEDVLFRYEVYKKIRRVVFSNLKKYNYFINANGITMGQLNKKDFSLLRNWDYIVEQEKETENYQYAKLNRARATYTLYVKGMLSGNKDVEDTTLKEWKKEIKDNYKLLQQGRVLDWKRKLILCFIMISGR